ncbi:MAG: hypothetical protein GKS05_10860 [Nitrospirales bacterium]|nr:hypothetical protein [Nitrospirales bacterium]
MQPSGNFEHDERVYAEAIKAHAKHAIVLYKAKIPQLERLSELTFEPDGSKRQEPRRTFNGILPLSKLLVDKSHRLAPNY